MSLSKQYADKFDMIENIIAFSNYPDVTQFINNLEYLRVNMHKMELDLSADEYRKPINAMPHLDRERKILLTLEENGCKIYSTFVYDDCDISILQFNPDEHIYINIKFKEA